MAENQKATVMDQSWGWIVCRGLIRTKKIASRVAAQEFADAVNAGEDWHTAWVRLKMRQWVREQDGGEYQD